MILAPIKRAILSGYTIGTRENFEVTNYDVYTQQKLFKESWSWLAIHSQCKHIAAYSMTPPLYMYMYTVTCVILVDDECDCSCDNSH